MIIRKAFKFKAKKRKEALPKASIFDKILPIQQQRMIVSNQMRVTRIANFCKGRFGFEPDKKLKA